MIFQAVSTLALALYALILWRFSRGLKAPASIIAVPEQLPTVTVVAPAHNEAANLPEFLNCLDRQDFPLEKLEILLVNDRSTDDTARLIDEYASCRPHVQTLHIDATPDGHSPKKHAIATAVSQASGDIIITTDCDGLPGPAWIRRMTASFAEQVDVVLGYAPYRTDGPFNTLFHRCLALEYFSLGAMAAASAGSGFALTANGVNFAYRRSLFDSVKGFGPDITELSGDDDLLLHRFIGKRQARVVFQPHAEAAVHNAPPANFRKFIKQRLRFSSKHPAYPPKVLLMLGAIYVIHVAILTSMAVFLLAGQWPLMLALAGIHMIAEALFLQKAAKIMEKRPLRRYIPLIYLPHLVYIFLVPIMAQIMPKRW